MRRKGTKQLERELKNLKTLINADSEFDYARRAEIARTAQRIVHEAATIRLNK